MGPRWSERELTRGFRARCRPTERVAACGSPGGAPLRYLPSLSRLVRWHEAAPRLGFGNAWTLEETLNDREGSWTCHSLPPSRFPP